MQAFTLMPWNLALTYDARNSQAAVNARVIDVLTEWAIRLLQVGGLKAQPWMSSACDPGVHLYLLVQTERHSSPAPKRLYKPPMSAHFGSDFSLFFFFFFFLFFRLPPALLDVIDILTSSVEGTFNHGPIHCSGLSIGGEGHLGRRPVDKNLRGSLAPTKSCTLG